MSHLIRRKYHRRWRQHRAITVETVDTVDTVNPVDTVDTVDTIDTVDTVDTVYTIETALHCYNISMYACIYCQGRLERYWNGLLSC